MARPRVYTCLPSPLDSESHHTSNSISHMCNRLQSPSLRSFSSSLLLLPIPSCPCSSSHLLLLLRFPHHSSGPTTYSIPANPKSPPTIHPVPISTPVAAPAVLTAEADGVDVEPAIVIVSVTAVALELPDAVLAGAAEPEDVGPLVAAQEAAVTVSVMPPLQTQEVSVARTEK